MISEGQLFRGGRPLRPIDAEAAYREEFLKLLAHLDLESAEAIALVEAGTGRRFEMCSPEQLVPVLQELLQVVRSYHPPVDARPPER